MIAPPPGFFPLPPLDGVMEAMAPLYFRIDDNDQYVLAFHVGPQHCNPRGHCHGGVWATMADLQLGMNVGRLTNRTGPTVSMSLDYLGSARTGQWVEGTTRLLRRTPRLAFVDATFTADGELVLRANAIFRLKWEPVAQLVTAPILEAAQNT